MIFNLDIWKYSEKKIHKELIDYAYKIFNMNEKCKDYIMNYIEIMLNFIDVYCNMEVLDEESLHLIFRNILIYVDYDINLDVVYTVLDHANIFYMRKFKNYLVQVYYAIKIFFHINKQSNFLQLF